MQEGTQPDVETETETEIEPETEPGTTTERRVDERPPEETERGPAALCELLADRSSIAIVCHDNPDPDCLGSAMALAAIAEWVGVEEIHGYYGGDITHQQNRAMVNLLDIDVREFDPDYLDDCDLLAFVDHSVPGANNAVPVDVTPDVVIDHHPVGDVEASYLDHRESVGATASILAEYLAALDMEVDEQLATGLLFGIRRETLEFMRGATPSEFTAARYLHPLADLDLLRRLSDSLFTHETLDSIADAIRNRTARGSILVSHAGRTTERDTLPQAADYLLNLEGVSTTVVFGVIDDTVHISARSRDSRIHVGEVMRRTFDDIGSAGGHRDMAGGSIPLGLFGTLEDRDEQLIDLVAATLTRRLFSALSETVRK